MPWLLHRAIIAMSVEVAYQPDENGELTSVTKLLNGAVTVSSTFVDGSQAVTRALGFKNVGTYYVKGSTLVTKGEITLEATGTLVSANETLIWFDAGSDEVVIRTCSKEGDFDRRLVRVVESGGPV